MTMVFNVVMHFNSQPHEEADGTRAILDYLCNEFQLTASRGG